MRVQKVSFICLTITYLKNWLFPNWILWSDCVPTLKQRADFPPAGDASFTGELTQGSLQEKHRDATANEEDDIWNEERTCMNTRENTSGTYTNVS